jgi:hypothetical protein
MRAVLTAAVFSGAHAHLIPPGGFFCKQNHFLQNNVPVFEWLKQAVQGHDTED